MPGSIVQWSVVLVGLSVCGVWIQSLLELWVALIQMAGQHLIPIDESLTELCRYVSHLFLYRGFKVGLTQQPLQSSSTCSRPIGQHTECPKEKNKNSKLDSFMAVSES